MIFPGAKAICTDIMPTQLIEFHPHPPPQKKWEKEKNQNAGILMQQQVAWAKISSLCEIIVDF